MVVCCLPVKVSFRMALQIEEGPAQAAPCMKRSTSSVIILLQKIAKKLLAEKTSKQGHSMVLRPRTSDSVPIASCPKPRPSTKMLKLIRTKVAEVCSD